jgi:rRNA maturation RNase YbeY
MSVENWALARKSKRERLGFPMLVEILRKDAGRKFSSRKLKTIARKVLELLEQTEAELSLALVGNAEIRKLNARYRRKDYPTDVLSFPTDDRLRAATRLLGDVVISVEKAKQQARERGRSLDEEMASLVIHGVVHLLGYDHERSAREARLMSRLEKKIYRALCDQGVFRV